MRQISNKEHEKYQQYIVELFSTNLGVWNGIRKAIERVNANALAA